MKNKYLFILFVIAVLSLLAVYGAKRNGLFQKPVTTEKTIETTETTAQKGHGGYEEPKPQHIEIFINKGSFEPEPMVVRVEDTIGWKNKDSVSHTVTSDEKGFAFVSEVIVPGETVYVTSYNKAGTYHYYLKDNPSQKGTLIVND